ncbi:DUF3618 domain-containing protein [Streptomyces glomeratus]|uniref:DUF3618 domain-containing protein n=1 Tax=Streptomyces glomeratus TaxID=284452 RepID=A0ABP6M4Z5_9ACTN|nr:DUF3618 domain-containing protein [Streptomyces glomeratus]MCF1512727.1 DUF3618 domain-containing protein [Streptomyces glomeratus]
MGTAPHEIRADIEATRSKLSTDVARLADSARPSRMVKRRTRRARGAMRRVRQQVMGTSARAVSRGADQARQASQSVQASTSQAAQSLSGTVGQAAQTLQDTAGQTALEARQTVQQTQQAVKQAPEQAMRQTEGNPLAAGLIAFGAGALAAALIPTSQMEEEAASRASEQATPVFEAVKEAASESAQQLTQAATESAQQAAQEVQDTATQAARTTAEQAQDQMEQVTEQARESGKTTLDEARGHTTSPDAP